MNRKTKRRIMLVINLSLIIVLISILASIFIVGKANAESSISVEEQRQAIIETAHAFLRKGSQVQYDTNRKNLYASPEDATSQHTVYTVCSGFVFQTYYQTLGIELPYVTDDLLVYAEDNKDKTSTILHYYANKEEVREALETTDFTRNLVNELQPGDIFVATGHTFLIESVDRDNGNATLIEANGDAYDYTNHEEKHEEYGTIENTVKRQQIYEGNNPTRYNMADLDGRLEWYKNKLNNGAFDAKGIQMAIIRVITDGETYINTNNEESTYTVTNAAKTRLKYPNIDIEKIAIISDDLNNENQNMVANLNDSITYQITIKNRSEGNKYESFDVIEDIDSNLSLISVEEDIVSNLSTTHTVEVTSENNQLKWSIDFLEPAEEVTICYTVKVPIKESLLGNIIVSTGKVDNIATSKIEILIGNKLKVNEKNALSRAFNNLENSSKTEREFINEIYKEALDLDIGLTGLDNLEIMAFDTSIPQNGGMEDGLVVGYTKLQETAVKKYVYYNFYGLRIASNNIKDESLVKAYRHWNFYPEFEINDRARTLTPEMLDEGDIVLVYTGNTSSTDSQLVNKAYIYLGNKLIRKVSATGFEELSGDSLTTFLRNIVCDNYLVIRPAIGHTMLGWADNGNGTHSRKCTDTGCDYTSKIAESHIGGTHANGGKCAECSTVYETHSKSTTVSLYKDKTETQHTPVYKCSYSGCTGTYTGKAANHTVSTWTDNTNGTHSGNCTVCKYKLTDEHNYTDGKCTDCKAEEPKVECEHTYEKKADKENHWEECTKCKLVKSGSLKAHIYTNYKNNQNGTHSSTCTECNYELTEEHTEDCTDCNPTGTTPGEDGKEEQKDNTVIDDEKLPETGVSSVIMIGIITLGAVLAINIFKARRYKNI